MENQKIYNDNDVKAIITEFSLWNLQNNEISLLDHSFSEEGQLILKCAIYSKKFNLFCPASYPNYDSHFYLDSDSPLHSWCNSVNEYLLNSKTPRKVKVILDKALALYKLLELDSSSSSDSDGELDLEDESIKSEDLKEICTKPEVGKCAETNKVNHACNQQQCKNYGTTDILTKDLLDIMDTSEDSGIKAEPIENIFQWKVHLFFDSSSRLGKQLLELEKIYRFNFLELKLDFSSGMYPFCPPSLKIIRPVLLDSLRIRFSCSSMLKLSEWNPTMSMKSVLLAVKKFLSSNAHIDIHNKRNGDQLLQNIYSNIEGNLAELTSVYDSTKTEVVDCCGFSDNNLKSDDSEQDDDTKHSEELNVQDKSLRATQSVPQVLPQSQKDKIIVKCFQELLQELTTILQLYCDHNFIIFPSDKMENSYGTDSSTFQQSPNHICFSESNELTKKLKGSCGVKDVEVLRSINSDIVVKEKCDLSELQMIIISSSFIEIVEKFFKIDSYLNIYQHKGLFRCLIEIMNKLTQCPKLVPLFCKQQNGEECLHSAINFLSDKVELIITNFDKDSANGAVVGIQDKTFLCSSEDKLLLKDILKMNVRVTTAIRIHRQASFSDLDDESSNSNNGECELSEN